MEIEWDFTASKYVCIHTGSYVLMHIMYVYTLSNKLSH